MDMQKFDERCSRLTDLNKEIKPLRLTPFNYDILYRNEAVKCFHQHLPISCVVVSSALVETCLCWEFFRRKPKKERKTIELDEFRFVTLNSLFDEYIGTEIPLESLMDADEPQFMTIEDLKKKSKKERKKALGKIRYIATRNKFTHGDLLYPLTHLSALIPYNEQELKDYYIDKKDWWNPTLEDVAFVHLSKTLRFMKAFTDLLVKETE